MTLEYSIVSPAALFKEIKTPFATKSTEKGLDLILKIAPAVPEALVLDETRLRQILINPCHYPHLSRQSVCDSVSA